MFSKELHHLQLEKSFQSQNTGLKSNNLSNFVSLAFPLQCWRFQRSPSNNKGKEPPQPTLSPCWECPSFSRLPHQSAPGFFPPSGSACVRLRTCVCWAHESTGKEKERKGVENRPATAARTVRKQCNQQKKASSKTPPPWAELKDIKKIMSLKNGPGYVNEPQEVHSLSLNLENSKWCWVSTQHFAVPPKASVALVQWT